jgi:hypothetical protein
MIWNAPAAFGGLILVAGPVLVHLLVRSRARRVPFPSIRFVPAVRAAAVRPGRPSDVALLLLRVAIVAAAVLAAAQPVLVTAARQRDWNARVARAIVVDTSASVPRDAANALARAESGGALVSRTIASADLRDAISRAGAWLADAPAGRREIVVVSDFQRGVLSGGDLTGVPAAVGVRFVRAGQPSPGSSPAPAVDGWRGGRWTPSTTVDASGTTVRWQRAGVASPGAVVVRGAAADMPFATRALAAAASFGIPAPQPARAVEVVFAGAPAEADARPTTRWIADAAIALDGDTMLRGTGVDVTTRERDGRLVAHADVAVSSPLAPAIVRAVAMAAAPPVADPEAETAALDDGVLSRWRRDAAPSATAVPNDSSDGRWLWMLALALLGVETVARRSRHRAAVVETHADAA